MSQLKYLSTKTCAVCTKRLDCTYKRDVRTVKNDDIIQSLNSVKNRILTNKGKEIETTTNSPSLYPDLSEMQNLP
jgi:hypothetical protein